jgi:intracellular sulfur oxidation DsrE/DsrF family protein
MNRALLAAPLLALAGCAATAGPASVAGAGSKEVRMAFDVSSGNPVVVTKTLETIDLTRKQLIEQGYSPRIVVTFRGEASYYTQDSLAAVRENDRAAALQAKARMRQLRKASGVESFEQCNVPLQPLKLDPKALMPEVTLVPNGWIALVNYQHRGYAYIVP